MSVNFSCDSMAPNTLFANARVLLFTSMLPMRILKYAPSLYRTFESHDSNASHVPLLLAIEFPIIPHTPVLLTSVCSPLTCFSNFSTTLSSFLVGLDSGLGISIVFDLFGRNGIGVVGLEDKNYFVQVSLHGPQYPPKFNGIAIDQLTELAALNSAIKLACTTSW
jgi:hypothetical protein